MTSYTREQESKKLGDSLATCKFLVSNTFGLGVRQRGVRGEFASPRSK